MPNGFVGLTNIETNEKASLKVYPNPARDFINVDIEADRFSSSEIELFDIQGRLVKKSKLNAQIGNRILPFFLGSESNSHAFDKQFLHWTTLYLRFVLLS